MAAARHCDYTRKEKPDDKYSLFFGIPISVKDHIPVQGLGTSQGATNVFLKNRNTKEDQWLVRTLREKGAIFYVKTNIPQNMLFVESFNKLWGRSLNPWDKNRTTAGSSGGEAGLICSRGSIIGIGRGLLYILYFRQKKLSLN